MVYPQYIFDFEIVRRYNFLKYRKEEIKQSALKASFPIFKGVP
jgi:hypothetical protein